MEVVAARGSLSPATLAVLKRHCHCLGAGTAAPPMATPEEPAVPLTLLSSRAAAEQAPCLPAYLQLLAQAEQRRQQAAGGPSQGAPQALAQQVLAQQALALAVRQLQEARLAEALLPAAQMLPLGLGAGGADAAAAAAAGGGGGQGAEGHLVLDDRCIATLELLEVGGPRG